MIRRTLENKLKQAAQQYPIVTVTGPRQSGKTTLVRSVFHHYDYVSLEEPDQRDFALEDPRGFLGQFKTHAVLDEVQRAPDLFSYMQTVVDEEDRPGRFILTSSQNFLLLKTIRQTLAGRCSVLHLFPFSRGELYGGRPLKLTELGQTVSSRKDRPATDLMRCLFAGFYPRIHDKGLEPQDWLKNYYQTYLERDVRDIVNVGDLEAFRRFVGLCAGRNSQLLNLSSLAIDCGITHTTARRWISILETSFVVVLLRPHYRNFNKRLIKSPKLYFIDTGLLCYLLRIRSPEELFLHSARGAVFESFVISELHKRALHLGEDPDLYFWRDSAGHEVDIIIDRGDKQIPLEIKSGETVAKDFFKGIVYWRGLAGDAEAPVAIVYGGQRTFRQKGIVVYSWWTF